MGVCALGQPDGGSGNTLLWRTRILRSMIRLLVLVAVCSCGAVPALGQPTYVNGTLLGELTRSAHTDVAGIDDAPSADGEALGVSARVGTAVGDRWGVELEFVRSSAIERESRRSANRVPIPFPGPIPAVDYTFHLRHRVTSVDTLAWLRQYVTNKIDFVYVAGVGFHHVAQKLTVDFEPPRITDGLIGVILTIPSTETVSYRVGPVVGFESRIAFTDHAALVPGVRLHGIAGTLIVRAGAGVTWTF
jgi:hypothetical protein